MKGLRSKLRYYFWATYHRKILDKLQEENSHYLKRVVLDIGGRDRGKFLKPKDKVEKWIFADIEKKHQPDIILDVGRMESLKSESMDVVNAIELFEHVDNIEEGLRECNRVLKKEGIMIMSVPFLFPIHADPSDFQRWTEQKWKKNLEELEFKIEKFEIMGRYFSVFCDMGKALINTSPKIVKYFCYLFYPLMDLLVKLDTTNLVKNSSKLSKYHSGYFIILKKSSR